MNPVARRETPLAIAALVLWVLTAGAGLVLFITGKRGPGAAGRRAGQPAEATSRLSPPRRPQ